VKYPANDIKRWGKPEYPCDWTMSPAGLQRYAIPSDVMCTSTTEKDFDYAPFLLY